MSFAYQEREQRQAENLDERLATEQRRADIMVGCVAKIMEVPVVEMLALYMANGGEAQRHRQQVMDALAYVAYLARTFRIPYKRVEWAIDPTGSRPFKKDPWKHRTLRVMAREHEIPELVTLKNAVSSALSDAGLSCSICSLPLAYSEGPIPAITLDDLLIGAAQTQDCTPCEIVAGKRPAVRALVMRAALLRDVDMFCITTKFNLNKSTVFALTTTQLSNEDIDLLGQIQRAAERHAAAGRK